MNQKDFVDNIQEKFIKCSNCDHYAFDSAQGTKVEKFISFFFPSIVYICQNCKKKHIIFKGGPSINTKIIFILVPLILAGVMFLRFSDFKAFTSIFVKPEKVEIVKSEPPEDPPSNSLTPQNSETLNPKPADSNKESPIDTPKEDEVKDPPLENPENSTPDKLSDSVQGKPDSTVPVNQTLEPENRDITEEVPSQDSINGTIILNRRRYGVNWKQIENGIIITKMSPGPFMRAGMKIGDVIIKVDSDPAGAGEKLMALRNKVFNGDVKEVKIEVLRKGEVLKFLMRGKEESIKEVKSE